MDRRRDRGTAGQARRTEGGDVKTTTITREYDDKGNLVREIRVEREYADPAPITVGDDYWWRPQPGWWQNPVISYSSNTTALMCD